MTRVPVLSEDEAGLPGPAIGEPVALLPRQPFRAFRHREFRLLFGAYAIGDVGFWISHISLQSEMARVSHNSSLWLGILFFTFHYLVLRGFYSLEQNRVVFFVQCVVENLMSSHRAFRSQP